MNVQPVVNGQPADTGCWVEGHWGQYGPDHLADQAETLGWEPDTWSDDPRQLRDIADTIEAWNFPSSYGVTSQLWELRVEALDKLEFWLNDHTPPVCPDCGDTMYPTSDGFYRHDTTRHGTCGADAIDSPIFYLWGWSDGEFYLWTVEDWENSW